MNRRLAAVAAACAAASVLSGCEFDGAYDLPLPGGPVDADHSYTVTADFSDVLSVVPRSPVMVSEVVVGEVDSVRRDGWHAVVTLRIRDDIELPDNALAEIRQTSLLGEKFVELSAPAAEPVGRLEEGDHLSLAATSRNPEVEEVLGALSYVLSGGGVGQIKQISSELNQMMTGRTGDVRHLLGQLDALVGTLDDQKQDIISAMESINRLAATLNAEKSTITSAIDATGPALAVLNRQHEQLVGMLAQLDELGRVGTRVVNGTKENLLADLRHLEPVLEKLNETGDSLPRGLSLLISFPFPEEAAENVKGDYANALFDLNVSLGGLLQATGGGGVLELPDIPGLPPLPDLPIPSLPLPALPGLGGGQGQTGVGTGGGLLQGGLG